MNRNVKGKRKLLPRSSKRIDRDVITMIGLNGVHHISAFKNVLALKFPYAADYEFQLIQTLYGVRYVYYERKESEISDPEQSSLLFD